MANPQILPPLDTLQAALEHQLAAYARSRNPLAARMAHRLLTQLCGHPGLNGDHNRCQQYRELAQLWAQAGSSLEA